MNLERLKKIAKEVFIGVLSLTFIASCSGGGNNEGSDVGFVQLYNVSANSPEIIMIIGKDDDDDFIERRQVGVKFPSTGGQFDFIDDTYDLDLTWQDGDDTDDLETLYESQLRISGEEIKFLVFSGDVNLPDILEFDIPIIDDENDEDNDLFNLRVLNIHPVGGGVDVYMSESDETFEQAALLGNYAFGTLSENQKIDQDDYLFYLTSGGSSEVVYRSNEISLNSVRQVVISIRENAGSGESPFVIDLVSNTIVEYPDVDAQSRISIYNGIIKHELLPNYLGLIDLHLDGLDETPEVTGLAFGDYSEAFLTDFGDYSLSVTIPDTQDFLIENHLLTLDANSVKTIFFYTLLEALDEDGDGDIDEDGDGVVDGYEITTNSLVVENSQSQSIFEHQINVINIIDDFENVRIFFVKNDETTETTNNRVTAIYARPKTITLANNTYSVIVIGQDGSSEIILATLELTLNEETNELFLLLEESEQEISGYRILVSDQKG